MHRSPWIVTLGISLWLACTRPPVARPDPALLARADAELLQGCYDCLLGARASYRRLAAGSQRAQRLFEADLLLALREKELGLPASDALAEARRLATELPPQLEARRTLALVELVPADPAGVPRREMRVMASRNAALVARLPAEHAWLSRSQLREPVRRYLELALGCAFPLQHAPALPPDAPPLLRYRAEICGLGLIAALATIREHEPRFVETAFFIARIEIALAASEGPGEAKAHLAEARVRFPRSPAISYVSGSFELGTGNDQDALALFDRTLALQPLHEMALVGRTASLSHLGRSQQAIEAADRLIALGEDARAEGYYWRAWNRHALGQLADARADITAAKEWSTTPSVLGLSGIIHYDLGELDPAQADLEAALGLAAQDCTSRWYLALVHRARKTWTPAGRAFQDALTCFRARADDSAEQVRTLESRTNLDPAYRTSAIAALKTSIDADHHQWHLAALLAATAETNAAHPDEARALLELAAEDPSLAERVAKLRGRLDKPPR